MLDSRLRRRRDLRQQQHPARPDVLDRQVHRPLGQARLRPDEEDDHRQPRRGNLSLANDEYRIILVGNGSSVITDPQGDALDGENTTGAAANGTQLALPSGNGIPGGNFFVTFTIDTHPPAVVPHTMVLDASSDSGRRDGITDINKPSFDGTITDLTAFPNPAINAVAGETVFLDVLDEGDHRRLVRPAERRLGRDRRQRQLRRDVERRPARLALYNVGLTGLRPRHAADPHRQRLQDIARVRVVDQSGNQSNPFTDPLEVRSSREGATAGFVVDTQAPVRSPASRPADSGNFALDDRRRQATLCRSRSSSARTST